MHRIEWVVLTGGGEGTLEGDEVLLDRGDRVGGDSRHSINDGRRNITLLPLDRDL